MTDRCSSRDDRFVKIELLRARAAVQRETLMHDVAELSQSLSPSQLIRHFIPKWGLRNSSQLVWQLWTALRRSPVALSTLSAVLLRSRQSKLMKVALGVIGGWQLYRFWGARHEKNKTPPVMTVEKHLR